MTQRLSELDYTPLVGGSSQRLPAMVTLTYPADWLTVAPNGGAVKRHLDALRKRYERAWGELMAYIWKLEFQRRGAPHLHLLTCPPLGACHDGSGQAFPDWLSRVWADIVAHPDPDERAKHERAGTGVDYNEGLRAQDPKRVAVYFTKHGAAEAKGYQHRVPQAWQAPGKGPGRFWGYRNLRRVVAAQEVTDEDYTWAARLLRRYDRAKGVTREVTVCRTNRKTGRVRKRKVRRRVRRFTGGNRSGFLCVNDGAALGADLARAKEGLVRLGGC